MKQVTITIRDVDNRLRCKRYFSSVKEYLYEATDYIDRNLGPCYEVELKCGNKFKDYKLESDLESDARFNCTDTRFELDSWVTKNAVNVEKYLGK